LTAGELGSGAQIGKYRVVRRIGEGGMATIYLVSSVGPGGFEKPCALKLLKPDFSEGREISDLLLREARLAALLHHPNIVQVFDLGQRGSDYYMTMEWVDGLALSALLSSIHRAKSLLPVSAVAFVAGQVAEALEYLRRGVDLDGHQVGLVHRDVSPSNILLSNDGAVKLTDFGIVKVLEAPSVTKVGVVKGKYAYMSPEQIRGEPIDHRSDIFSLGVVLYEALTNRRLFSRKTLAATVAAVHAAKVLPPSTFNEAVPPELDQVVLRALIRDRDKRYPTGDELARALEPFTNAGAQRQLAQIVTSMSNQPVRDPRPLSASIPSIRAATINGESEDLPELRDQEFEELARLAESDEPPPTTRELLQPRRVPSAAHSDTPRVSSMGSVNELGRPSGSAWSTWLPLLVMFAAILGTLVFWMVVEG
jgi:serine/threonine protein kinase